MIARVGHGVAGAGVLLATKGPIVLFDALRMSATVLVALARGMTVVPVAGPQEALALKREPPEGGHVLTAGERDGWRIPALDLGNSPSDLLRWPVPDPPSFLALTTSNGIPALLAIAGHQDRVLIGSPLNLTALAAALRGQGTPQIGILLAGHRSEASMEDALTASILLEHLGVPVPEGLPRPIPPAEIPTFFANTPAGRRLVERGEEADLHLCASVDRYRIVPRLEGGRIVPDAAQRVQGGR